MLARSPATSSARRRAPISPAVLTVTRAIELGRDDLLVVRVLPVDQPHRDRRRAGGHLQLVALRAERADRDLFAAAEVARGFGQRARRHDVVLATGAWPSSSVVVNLARRYPSVATSVIASPSSSSSVPISTAPRASSLDAAKIVASIASRNFLAAMVKCEPRVAAGSGGYSFGGQRVKVVVAAFVLDAGARRRSGELQHSGRQISEVAREQLGRHRHRAALGDLGRESVFERQLEVGRADGDLPVFGLEQHVREDRHRRVRVDDLAGGSDRRSDVLGVAAKLHHPPIACVSLRSSVNLKIRVVTAVGRCILRRSANSSVAAAAFRLGISCETFDRAMSTFRTPKPTAGQLSIRRRCALVGDVRTTWRCGHSRATDKEKTGELAAPVDRNEGREGAALTD